MKKSLAVMLALIMVLCMIPTTAFAADIIDQKNKVYIYKGEPQNSYFLRQIDGGSITKSKNEEVIWQRLPRYTSKCGRCNNVVEEVIPDLYCINPDKNIEITNPEVIGEYGVRVASWKGNDVYNGYPCFEFYCKAAKAGETDVKVTYYYNYNYRGASGYCNYCGNFVYVQAQTNWYKESVTFHVTCETQEPPTDNPPTQPEPENTSKPFIELTGEEAVKVHCTNDKANHDDKSYGLMHDGYTVGDVKADATNGYTCDITVNPDKYVDQYNLDIEVEHKLDPESQTGTIKLVWDKENQKWKLANPSDVPVVFKVKCDNTQPPLDTITIEVSKVWHDDSNTVTKPDAITVLLLADGKEVDRATIPDVNGAWSHSFGAKPANDNGKPINYTVKEENVPDWTPYYYTAGLWKGKLIFQIHNVPTKNTREIKVTKTVSGEGADTTKEFNFKVTLLQDLDGNGEIGDGTHPLSDTYTFGGVTFTNGEATFKLKHGESFTITGIPSHVQYLPLQYKVEEIAPSGYTVKVNGSADSSISGAFTDAKTVEINFENIKESGTNPTPSPSTDPSPTPTPTPGGGNGGGGHWHPTTTPVPVIVIPPKTGDMTIWQSILHFLGIR